MGATVNILREKLHQYIDHVEDKKIKAFYTIVQADIEEEELVYTNELKAELDKRYNAYKAGKTKMITATESKKRIEKLLKNKLKK
jgi:putative addiction module component (TIGR02574 family)